MKGNQSVHQLGHVNSNLLKGDRVVVHRQAVEGWTVQGSERFEVMHRLFLGKNLGIALQCMGSIEDAGTTAGGLLAGSGVRGRVSAEEKRDRRWWPPAAGQGDAAPV